jgi:cellulose synthase/poly-beta-1,6-N-acetylglucosamine synthase-like glycosyltransferase
MPTVSIIIPVREVNAYIRESIPHILGMDYKDFEIIIFPDAPSSESFPKTTVIPTGSMGPAEKRDLALKYAKGEILAFLDDDAYPRRDWLENAIRNFKDPEVAAVGGPAVTPDDDPIWHRVSGAVFESWLTSGEYGYRYAPRRGREVDDFPTVNLLVRRDVFEKIGGFDSEYWPGEDTKLCLDITKRLGKKIIYDPGALVYHHRRPIFKQHLKQVGRYAYHRGYFAKVLPETSMKISYFIPSLFLLGLIFGGVFSLMSRHIAVLYLGILSVYGILLLGSALSVSIKGRDVLVGALVMPGILTTHLVYGFNFLRGISAGKYNR